MLKINMVQVKETRLTIQAEVQVMQEYLAETDAIEKCKERMRMSAHADTLGRVHQLLHVEYFLQRH